MDKSLPYRNKLFESKVVKYILKIFGFNYGRITLVGNGVRSLKIETDFTPCEVWINISTNSSIQNQDSFSWEITSGGFNLNLNMVSDYRSLDWVARK